MAGSPPVNCSTSPASGRRARSCAVARIRSAVVLGADLGDQLGPLVLDALHAVRPMASRRAARLLELLGGVVLLVHGHLLDGLDELGRGRLLRVREGLQQPGEPAPQGA
jgi:hypothetical protein